MALTPVNGQTGCWVFFYGTSKSCDCFHRNDAPAPTFKAQPSLSWTNDTDTPIRAFTVCSDAHVGKRRKNTDNIAEIKIHDLAFPATTDLQKVAETGSAEAVSSYKSTLAAAGLSWWPEVW